MSLSTMPNIWGEGKLIAFSGLDGPTSWRYALVGSATTRPLGIRFHLGPDVLLSFGANVQLRDAEMVLGDAAWLIAQTSDGPAELKFAFADCWRLRGSMQHLLMDYILDPPLVHDLAAVEMAKQAGGAPFGFSEFCHCPQLASAACPALPSKANSINSPITELTVLIVALLY